MTILNLISICVTVAVVTAAVMLYRKARRAISDADGLGDVNTRGDEFEDVVAVMGVEAPGEDAAPDDMGAD